MLRTILAAGIAGALWVAASPGAAQQDRLTLAYDIILSGATKMGNIRMEIYPDADAGVLVVEGEQHISILGRKVDITWTEKWRDDRLVAYDGKSDINKLNRKANYTISLRENGEYSVLTVNGTAQRVPADIAPRSFWRKGNVVGRTVFFDIDDGKVSEEAPFLDGEREIEFKGKDRKTEFWKIRGEKSRDFWFLDANDVLVKYQRPRGPTWYTYELTSIE
ncbi:MAG: DUF6134 family protein [Kiloniellales bacterium]